MVSSLVVDETMHASHYYMVNEVLFGKMFIKEPY